MSGGSAGTYDGIPRLPGKKRFGYRRPESAPTIRQNPSTRMRAARVNG